MKRLFSSLFILLILFNVMGYYGLLVGFQYKNTRDLLRQFDAGTYEPGETETLKIPFRAPYAYGSETFQRVDGNFERDGELYRLIKQRLFRDTFHIVYMKDITGTAINKALSDYVKNFSDNTDSNDQDTTVIPLFIKEYFARHFSVQHLCPGWMASVRKESSSSILIDIFTSSILHPPERG